MLKDFRRAASVIFIFVILTYAYLYPGSQALIEKRNDVVMSDDTDPSSLPYLYDQLVKVAHENPSWLLYGAVYLPVGEPGKGTAYWVSWNERVSVLIGSFFVNNEQLSTFFIGLMMVISGLSMYALARSMSWNHWVALGLGIGWAFSAYMRARAKVHGGFVGCYHLPLIFLGLNLVVIGRDLRSLIKAAFAFLIASTVAYYYILTTLFISPFFVAYLFIQKDFRNQWQKIITRLGMAVGPSLLFLGLSFTFLLPADSPLKGSDAIPKTGESQGYEYHPFLDWYAAHPIDYLTSDLSLSQDVEDWNPLRQLLNENVVNNLQQGNTHERTNGIRWLILILAVTSLIIANRSSERHAIAFFACMLLFTFWLSLSPRSPMPLLSPSYWLHSIFSQIRVPSRAGIIVHFCSLLLAGYALNWLFQRDNRYGWLAPLFPILMLVEYPPFYQQMPMAEMRAPFSKLQRTYGACGTGLYLPFFNPSYAALPYYHFLQRMRGSDCHYLNAFTSMDRVQWMLERFPPTRDFISGLSKSPAPFLRLKRLAECVPLSFVIFDPVVPDEWAKQTCSELGWQWSDDRSCLAPNHSRPLERYPNECGY